MPEAPTLLSRLRTCLEAGADDVRLGAPAGPPPEKVSWERFVAQPIPLASAALVAAPGDWFTHHASGAPLLVVRGEKDGALRVFLNACLHQGNRIVASESGQGAESFQCSMHGWTYDTCGKLTGGPAPADRPAQDTLVGVNVEERAGMVFAVPSTTDLDVSTWLGAFAEEIGALGLPAYRSARRMEQVRRGAYRSLAGALVDAARLGGWANPRTVLDADGPHLRFAVAPADAAPADLFAQALRGWFLFPSTLVLLRGAQVHLVGLFVHEDGRLGWRHELLVAPGVDPDMALALAIERRLFEAETVPPRDVPGVAWLDRRLASP